MQGPQVTDLEPSILIDLRDLGARQSADRGRIADQTSCTLHGASTQELEIFDSDAATSYRGAELRLGARLLNQYFEKRSAT